MDSTEKQQSRTSPSALFDSTSNNLYNNSGNGVGATAVHPLHEIRRPSPSLQSDTMSQSSNNNEEEESGLCSVFERLKTDDQRRLLFLFLFLFLT